MPSRDPRIWMWAEALDMMDKAERMHRQFFQPGTPAQGRRPTWQPPVDLIETADEYLVVVALPGVRPDQVQVVVDGGRADRGGRARFADRRQDRPDPPDGNPPWPVRAAYPTAARPS